MEVNQVEPEKLASEVDALAKLLRPVHELVEPSKVALEVMQVPPIEIQPAATLMPFWKVEVPVVTLRALVCTPPVKEVVAALVKLLVPEKVLLVVVENQVASDEVDTLLLKVVQSVPARYPLTPAAAAASETAPFEYVRGPLKVVVAVQVGTPLRYERTWPAVAAVVVESAPAPLPYTSEPGAT
jgi:hypothetical protein